MVSKSNNSLNQFWLENAEHIISKGVSESAVVLRRVCSINRVCKGDPLALEMWRKYHPLEEES